MANGFVTVHHTFDAHGEHFVTIELDDDLFDTAVLYNAVGHLEEIIDEVLSECRRVVKPNGDIYLISSFKMDKWFLRDTLLRRLQENVEVQEIEPFLFVKIMNH